MIQIRQLHKSYDDATALDHIDLNIRAGAITGLLGPNGAGKTTLVSILTGVIKKTGGSVSINGHDIDTNLAEIQTVSSIVPQSLALYPLLTIRENLEYFGSLYGLSGKRLKERINFSIEVASLHSFLNKRSGKCSGGMQRRLNIAIGLLNDPEILYLDEPTVGVDAQSRQYMLEMIRTLNREKKTTIIYTSHYISEIQLIADDIVIIDNGRIILKKTMQEVISSHDAIAIHADSPCVSLRAVLAGLPGVTCESGSIYAERNDQLYQNLISIFTAMDEQHIMIKNIQYNSNKLEDLYMQMTSKNLRDEE